VKKRREKGEVWSEENGSGKGGEEEVK